MKPGRFTESDSSRSRSGIPSTSCGSGSLSTVTCASVGSIWSAWRTITLPRSYGPATAWITVTMPNGAPRYGPVR